MDIHYALEQLLIEKRIYVSEADFQFSFAWKIKELYPAATVRLEYIPWLFDVNMHIDIMVFSQERMIPIELKYKTKLANVLINGEHIYLKNHSAQDVGRYDFLSDIQRLEGLIASNLYPIDKAYAIMMTNDAGYWNKSRKSGTADPPVDDEFRIHEGIILTGNRCWKENTSAGTKKNREKTISLKGAYKVNWTPYKPVDNCLFKYIAIKI
ncbi:MAG: hypothetical protein ACOYVD_13240 [Bacillota bacterium]